MTENQAVDVNPTGPVNPLGLRSKAPSRLLGCVLILLGIVGLPVGEYITVDTFHSDFTLGIALVALLSLVLVLVGAFLLTRSLWSIVIALLLFLGECAVLLFLAYQIFRSARM